MAGAILASVLGGVGSSASSGMASAAQYQASKHERNIAWKRQQAWELMAPGLRRAGLEAAGFNPILAVTQGMSGGASHVAQGSPGSAPDFSSLADIGPRAMASAKQSKIMADQVATVKATRDSAIYQAAIKRNEALASAYLPERAYHEAGAAGEQWSKLNQEVLNLVAERDRTSSQTRKYDVEGKLLEMTVPSARAMEELYTKYPWLRQIQGAMGGGVGSAVTGAAGAAAGYMAAPKPRRVEHTHRRR